MKRFSRFLLALVWMFFVGQMRADEGMWLPNLLSKQQYEAMVARGFRLSAEDLYSVNKASLKDAIVLFGKGCTGDLVSAEGLLLTNHHCGYSRIQEHSSVTHDYLTDGFWAMSKQEELSNPGLTASILVRMEDVTPSIQEVLTRTMSEKERAEAIRKRSAEIIKEAVGGTQYEGEVKSFFYGNQFILIIMEVFKDVRLVGAPPSSIGKFGGDTDNWMWPRHTGDFSIFRIYADKNNQPADFAKDNVPYKPRKFFEISVDGVHEGDFTMVYGFPGTTEEYLPSFAIRHFQENIYPITIGVRDTELDILNQAMASSQELRIMYAPRQASVANGWKKLKGVLPGLERYSVADTKTDEEQERLRILAATSGGDAAYKQLLDEYQCIYNKMKPADIWNTAFNECFWKQPFFRFVFKAYWLPSLETNDSKEKEKFDKTIDEIAKTTTSSYKGMDIATEAKLMAAMMARFTGYVPREQLPPFIAAAQKRYGNDYTLYINDLFASSLFGDSVKAREFFQGWKSSSLKKLKKDPLFRLMSEVVDYYRNISLPMMQACTATIDSLNRLHMHILMDMAGPGALYPDANSTLRITFGEVLGSEPRDGVHYLYRSTLNGILMKEDPAISDYTVPQKLKDIARSEFFGHYGDGGELPVAFIATNHTTGGNSGSPVLDASGRLIGLNFDRAWEGTMSDLHYEPAICRNISLDIRYLLFVVDKYAGATHLIDEMVIRKNQQ
jgi:hypothetical protein